MRAYLDSTVRDPSTNAARGDGDDVIRSVRLLDVWAAPADQIQAGDGLEVETETDRTAGPNAARVRVRIVHGANGLVAVDTSTEIRRVDRFVTVHFDRLDLAPGQYRVEIAVFSADWAVLVDEAESLSLTVRGDGPDTAVLDPPHEWRRG